MLNATHRFTAVRRSWIATSIRGMHTAGAIDDFACQVSFLREMNKNQSLRYHVVNALAFSSDEDAFKHFFTPKPSDTMMEQLRISRNQLTYTTTDRPIPRTMTRARRERRQAIVVTEAHPPFKIVYVNSVWEGLCGWSQEECQGKTLSLLQGQETDVSSITPLLSKLLQGEEAGIVLTNYTKDGRRFRNHLRVGPMEEGLFVGVLQEIHD